MMYWIFPRSAAAAGSFMAAGSMLPVSGVGAPAMTQYTGRVCPGSIVSAKRYSRILLCGSPFIV